MRYIFDQKYCLALVLNTFLQLDGTKKTSKFFNTDLFQATLNFGSAKGMKNGDMIGKGKHSMALTVDESSISQLYRSVFSSFLIYLL